MCHSPEYHFFLLTVCIEKDTWEWIQVNKPYFQKGHKWPGRENPCKQRGGFSLSSNFCQIISLINSNLFIVNIRQIN